MRAFGALVERELRGEENTRGKLYPSAILSTPPSMAAMRSNCNLRCERLVTDSLNYDTATAYRLKKITPKNLKIFGHIFIYTRV
jgi:hypothetical protein